MPRQGDNAAISILLLVCAVVVAVPSLRSWLSSCTSGLWHDAVWVAPKPPKIMQGVDRAMTKVMIDGAGPFDPLRTRGISKLDEKLFDAFPPVSLDCTER